MKKTLPFLLFALIAIALNSCFTPKPVYQLNVKSIYKTTHSDNSEINISGNNVEDSIFNISITLNEMNEFFNFKIRNKSQNEIFIKWDDARMIYKQDTTKFVVMNEDALSDLIYKNVLPQKTDTIGRTSMSFFLYPTNNFVWIPTNKQSGYWSFKELVSLPGENIIIKIPFEVNGSTFTYILNYNATFVENVRRYDPIRTNEALATMGLVGVPLFCLVYIIVFL